MTPDGIQTSGGPAHPVWVGAEGSAILAGVSVINYFNVEDLGFLMKLVPHTSQHSDGQWSSYVVTTSAFSTIGNLGPSPSEEASGDPSKRWWAASLGPEFQVVENSEYGFPGGSPCHMWELSGDFFLSMTSLPKSTFIRPHNSISKLHDGLEAMGADDESESITYRFCGLSRAHLGSPRGLLGEGSSPAQSQTLGVYGAMLAGGMFILASGGDVGPRSQYGAVIFALVGFSNSMSVAAAPNANSGCPACQGNIASCTFGTDGKCPAASDIAANIGVVASGTGTLALTHVLEPAYIKIFTRASLESLVNLAKRPAPGTSFELTDGTKGTAILSAIGAGLITFELAVMKLGELIESCTDASDLTKLKTRLDMLKMLKETGVKDITKMAQGTAVELGIYTYLWAKVSEYVMVVSETIKLECSGGSSSVFSAKLHRPSTMEEFSEMMNMFTVLCVAIGLATGALVGQFFQAVVFRTIRLRRRSWKFAHELLLIYFGNIEDSSGEHNLNNVKDAHFQQAAFEEAERNVLLFFRSRGGTPREENEPTNAPKYTGKFSKNAKPCACWNLGKEHEASNLDSHGVCKRNHVCNKWVSNKGKFGRCLGEAGTPGHRAIECDNPNKCDEPVKN
jgi:hypothetical protein